MGKLKFEATIKLDPKWESHQTDQELWDYLQERLQSSLGFRGQVVRLKCRGIDR